MPKRLIVLGSTGSIGKTALEVARDFPDRFNIVGLSTNRNTQILAEQIAEFAPKAVCVAGKGKRDPQLGAARTLFGDAGLSELVRSVEADLLLVATVGFAGLAPTLAGIEAGMDIALANKEVLVVGGELVMRRARERGVRILPVDSEHNAIFQCLEGQRGEDVRRVILTASGGPFREWSAERIASATREQALAHPTWDMGDKISIDSASLMNKGFEAIEACHLFKLHPGQVDVLVHPQSVVHSMVEFRDGSLLAQLGPTDMYLPILHALSWPERAENKFQPLDLAHVGSLDFAEVDWGRFPCLGYAYEAIRRGGLAPAALNAANEVAVRIFLEEGIPFRGIAEIVHAVLERFSEFEDETQNGGSRLLTLEDLRRADARAREMAEEYAGNFSSVH